MSNKKGVVVRAITIFLLSFYSIILSQPDSDVISYEDSTKTLHQQEENGARVEASDNNKSLNSLSKFTLLPYSKLDSITTKLIAKGIDIDKGSIVSGGILDSSDSHRYLQIIFLDENNQQVKKNFLLDFAPSESSVVTEKISEKYPEDGKNTITIQPPKLRQDGRVYFMINCAGKSIYVYADGLSSAFPDLSMRESKVITGISFLSVGLSLYGSYLFTQNMEMGYGRVEFMNYGGDVGIIYPTLLYFLLENVGEFKHNSELYGWGRMLLFPTGIFVGSKVKFTGNFEYGNASLMTNMSRFGIMYGFALPRIFSPPKNDNKRYLIYSTSLSMAFIPAGFSLGKILVDKYGPFSSGRSVFITTCGVMGSLSGLLIPRLWDEEHLEVYPITTIMGHIGGTLFGFNYMKERKYTFGQGMFMIASAVVGTAVGEAFPLIARVDNNHKPYIIFGIIGSWVGLIGGEALACSLFEKSSRDNVRAEKYNIKLAGGIYQLPLLWAYSKNKNLSKEFEIRVPVMEVNF